MQLGRIKVTSWELLTENLWITGVYKSRVQAIWNYGPKTLRCKPGRRLKIIQRSRMKESFLYTRDQVQPDKSVTPIPTVATNYWHMGLSACKEWVPNLPMKAHQTTGNQEMFSLVLSLSWLWLLHAGMLGHPLFFWGPGSSKNVIQPPNTWTCWTDPSYSSSPTSTVSSLLISQVWWRK